MICNKNVMTIIFLFSIGMSTSSFADDCIPGKLMEGKPPAGKTTSEHLVYSSAQSGYTFNRIPDENLSMSFVNDGYSISTSDWCYSPAMHAIKFLKKPLHIWDSNNMEIREGASLYIYYYPADSSSQIQLAAGSYRTRAFDQKPLILRSSDQGASWSAISDIIYNPSNAKDEVIASSYCTESTCIASGYYRNHGQDSTYPMLLVSKNKGKSWSYVKYEKPVEYLEDAKLHTTHCFGKHCIAAGKVGLHANDYHHMPLIMFSNDNGQLWSKADIAEINLFDDRGEINSAFCTTATKCIASGSFSSKNIKKNLMMLISNDSGNHWQFNHNISNLPSSMMESEINEVHCKDNACIAVGSYKNKDYSTLPLLLKSRDAGDSWTFTNKIVNFPIEYKNVTLNNVSCSNNYCVSAGINNESPSYKNLIALVSHDNGDSWTYLRNTVLPASIKYGEIYSVYGINNIFTILGSYFDNANKAQPIFLISYNNGLTWSNMPKIQNFPVKWRSLSLNSINCKNQNCYIAGQYDNNVMMLKSNNGGNTWSFVEKNNILDLPTFIDGVLLVSTSII